MLDSRATFHIKQRVPLLAGPVAQRRHAFLTRQWPICAWVCHTVQVTAKSGEWGSLLALVLREEDVGKDA